MSESDRCRQCDLIKPNVYVRAAFQPSGPLCDRCAEVKWVESDANGKSTP